MRTVGVEEEFLLVDPDSGRPRAAGPAALRAAVTDGGLTAELQREQLETGTAPCADLDTLGQELRAGRAAAAAAAAETGAVPVAVGTSPLPAHPTVSDDERYRRMADRFGITVPQTLACGCHVHVSVASDEEGVAALDRVRPWLAPLLALSSNSPFWQGEDTGYAAYRTQVWRHWPSAGSTEAFGSAATYHEVVDAMVRSGTILDEGMVYFDVRLSHRHPTLEIRVADVCRDVDDAVLIAALSRALVETAVREWRAGHPVRPVRVEMLRLASWRACLSGLDGELLDPRSGRPLAANEVVDMLVQYVRGALEDVGDADTVAELLAAVRSRGTGATRQRAVLAAGGDLRDVVIDSAVTARPPAVCGRSSEPAAGTTAISRA